MNPTNRRISIIVLNQKAERRILEIADPEAAAPDRFAPAPAPVAPTEAPQAPEAKEPAK